MAHPPSAPTIECLTEWPAFQSLHGEWNELARDCARRSVFLTHEWFDAAWQWAGLDAKLHVLCARRDGMLIGALPLVLRRRQVRSIERRVLEFLTVPDTQMCDVLARPEDEGAACETFARALGCSKTPWDVLSLSYLPSDSLAVRYFADALRRTQHELAIEPAGTNPFVDLRGSWDAYYGTRSRSLKKAINLAANRLKKAGEVAVTWHRPGELSAATTGEILATLTDISARSWKQDTGNSLDHPGPQAFAQGLSTLAADQGWLSVWTLSVDGKPLAMEYQLVSERTIYALRSDFDAAYGEISPGSHLFRQLLERLFEGGVDRYFMGPGENAYKIRWAEGCEELQRLTAYARTARGRFASFVDLSLAPFIRSIRSRMRRADAPAVPAEQAEATEK